jgi:phage/plasmid-associated DNA primase
MLREPGQPLPYLFFHSKEQNTGKSSFWESLSLLLTKGCQKAEAALTSQQGFNDELHGAILCSVEEIDLKNNKIAYNRIKDWVTGRELLIHPKGGTPYQTPNTTHWVQCSNDHQSCPIFGEDTRIVMIHVGRIAPADLIPRKAITILLEKEAPDFLAEVLNLELPASNDRLNIPAIETEDKIMAASLNRDELEVFLDENCIKVPGARLRFGDLYDRFIERCDQNLVSRWSKIRVGKSLPHCFPKGRSRQDAQFYIGNIDFVKTTQNPTPKTNYILCDNYLDLVVTQ